MSLPSVYSDELYANSFARRVRRSAEIGWRYYLWSLPRYLALRWSLGLSPFDAESVINPVREFFDRKQKAARPPCGYDEALGRLGVVGMRLTLPPSRVIALLNCWAAVGELPGDVIECGSYRGATALLMALMAKLHGRHQKILMFDTFSGSPEGTKYDSLRTKREYVLPARYCDTLRRQAAALGVEEQVEIHAGEFRETFKALEERPLRFSFAHIDANLYESTWDACNFVMPRMAGGGAVVFDDYHGPCDLGARLAIDRYLAPAKRRPKRLAGNSAVLTA